MFYRQKAGKGFTYKDNEGNTVKDKELRKWFKSLAIPPAWTDVEISESKRTKVLAFGRDDKNRKQYIYNPSYRKRQEKKKFDRIIRFAEQLETMRRVTGQHMRQKEMSKQKVCATMVRLLDNAYFRPGNPQYTKRNGTYGLTTLRSKHLEIDDNSITFNYTGKSGQEQLKEIEDERLAKIVKELDEMPGYRVFKYYDENGNRHEVESSDLNEYINDVMGEEFHAKDFRTWAGTMVASLALEKLGVVEKNDQKKLDENIREAVITVSEMLGNTPSVARSSYIDPRVIDQYMSGQTVSFFQDQVTQILEESENLSDDEKLVLCMLKSK